MIRDWILSVFHHLQRPPREMQESGQLKDRLFKYGVILLVFAGSFWMHFGPMIEHLRIWGAPTPILAIPASDWRVLHEDPSTDFPPPDSAWARAVPRSPISQIDWLSKHPGATYWVGARVPQGVLVQARKQNANQLILGWIAGSAQIWLNQSLTDEQKQPSVSPIIIKVNQSFLREAKDLFIAIRIKPVEMPTWADAMNFEYGGEGFLDESAVNELKERVIYIDEVQPFALFIIDLIIGLTLLLLWHGTPKKQELFYFGIFLIDHSAINLMRFKPMGLSIMLGGVGNETSLIKCQVALLLLSCALTIAIALAFARTRKRIAISVWCVMAIILGVFSALASVKSPQQLMPLLQPIFLLIPACCLISAVICGLQAYALRLDQGRAKILMPRISRLSSFAFWMAFLGIFQVVCTLMYAGTFTFKPWFPFVFYGWVLGFFRVILVDYRDTENMRSSIAFSEYHQPSMLGQPVHGAILVLDLKGCEALFRAGMAQGDSDQFITPIMCELSNLIESHGGIRISIVDGDMLKAFFPDRDRPGLVRSIEASCAMTQFLEKHSEELIAQEVLETGRTLSFRGGVATGQVKAVMDKTGPNWVHVGDSLPFVEAARLLQLESEWSHDKNTTYLFIAETATQELLKSEIQLGGTWIDHSYRQQAKHGVEYVAGIFKPALKIALPALTPT